VQWWTIQPSRILDRILFIGQILTGAIILVLSPDSASKVLLLLAVHRYCDSFSALQSSAYRIRYLQPSGWALQSTDYSASLIAVVPAGFYRPCSGWLLLRYRRLDSGPAMTLVLAPDSLDRSAYYRLCRYLQWGG